MFRSIFRVAAACGAVVREIGASMGALMPPLRSSDGTYGTQRIQARARAAQRKKDYPG